MRLHSFQYAIFNMQSGSVYKLFKSTKRIPAAQNLSVG